MEERGSKKEMRQRERKERARQTYESEREGESETDETKEERRAENFGPVRMNEGHFQAH